MARVSLDVWLPDQFGQPAAREPEIFVVSDAMTVDDFFADVGSSLEVAGVEFAHMIAGASVYVVDGGRPRAIEAVLNPKTGRLYFGGPDGSTSRVPLGALVASAREGLFGDVPSDPLPLAAVVEGGRGDAGAALFYAHDFSEWLATHGLETTFDLVKDGLVAWLGYAIARRRRAPRAGRRLRKVAANWVAHAITSPAVLRVVVDSKSKWVANDLARKMGIRVEGAQRLLSSLGYLPSRSGDWSLSSKRKAQLKRAAWIADESDVVQVSPADFEFLEHDW